MANLKGKTVVITGGSSGIGARIGLYVAKKGAVPVLLARSLAKLEEVRDEIQEKTGIAPVVHRLDVSDPDAIETVFGERLKELDQIDILVNNAGFGVFDFFHEADLQDLKNMLDVNVFGLMACTRKVLPQMVDRNSGHIINVASLAGKIATPKSTVYSATKHAVLGFSNGLRMEVADQNIHVTTVNPGPVNTNFFNIADESGDYVKNVAGFMLEPDDVARKVVRAMEKPRREINVPFAMSAGTRIYQLFPWVTEKMIGKFMKLK
ncbi:MAG TPA: SDR family oxidoreductase [Bacillales bacterium]|nr:SDR family oxidoreductase [Bacillales bacterium]